MNKGLRSLGRSRLQVHVPLALATWLAIASSGVAAEPDEQSGAVTYPRVSEDACPAEIVTIPGKAGNEVTIVVRQPPGSGPFPAIVLLHGGLSPYPTRQIKDESLTRPNYTRFLASGFVIAVPTFRSREENPQTRDALDDCLSVVEYVKKKPAVDPDSVAVFGGSGGGSLALELAGEGDLCAAIAGEPASVLFTGMMVTGMSDRGPAFQDVMRNPIKYYTPELQAFTRAKIAQIHCPVMIAHGDKHPINLINHEIIIPEMRAANKPLDVIAYAGQPHSFYWGVIADPAAGKKFFGDAMAFLKPHLQTQPVPLDGSLIEQVPVGGRTERDAENATERRRRSARGNR